MGIGTTTLIVATIVAVPGEVVEFERAADEWLAAVENEEVRAFDEFVPGLLQGQGCLISPPYNPVVLELEHGDVVVSALDSTMNLACPLYDGTGNQVSDGYMVGTEGSLVTLQLQFEPPVNAFYGFYGSLVEDGFVTMQLFGPNGDSVTSLAGPVSEDAVSSIGHGFVSSVPIGRLEFTTTEDMGNGITLLGAFHNLALDEPSLGSIRIIGYVGPDGRDVIELDFGVVFVSAECSAADLTNDGIVDFRDILFLLALWGPCENGCFGADIDGDGVVGFSDLLIVLREWGICS